MTTRDSESSNLLDEFFAPPKDDSDEEVEVVDEVEEGDEADAAAISSAAPRRSLPPPPPSKRASRGSSAPPPRGRGASRPPAPPPPPSPLAKSTFRGTGELPVVTDPPLPGPRSTLVGMPEPIFHAPPADTTPEELAATHAVPESPSEQNQDIAPTIEASGEEPRARGQLEPETVPGGLEDAQETAPGTNDFDAAAMGASVEQGSEHAEGRPSGETDMSTAFAGSLSLRGDTPSDTGGVATGMDEVALEGERERTSAIFDAAPSPVAAADAAGPSSAWPNPSKIDEWDDEWAPSLSALGAGQQEGTLRETFPESPSARASTSSRAPFRLSLPPPPPPPPKRRLPLPRPEADVSVSVDVEEPVAEAATASDEPESPSMAETPPAPETQPGIEMQVSAFGSADEPSGDDLTRPLPPTELARLAADEGQERTESELLRDDVTIPLPGLSAGDAASEALMMSALPDPYTSDTDLTRPLIAFGDGKDGGRVATLPLPRSMGDAQASGGNDVPLIVAVPPPTVGTVEQAPSIQITPGAPDSEYTPTSQLARPFSPTRTSPGSRGALPPIPKPAPVPSDFGRRGPSHSVAPVAGSVFPPGFTQNKRWLIGLAAAVLGIAALGVGLHNRSGSIVVTVAGPSGAAVPGVSVRIDGTERCNTAPCIVKDLKPGMHLVSAAANGLPASADRAIVLEPGEQVAQHVILSSEERATAGLSVSAIGTGLHVTVDGRDVGAPPVTLNDVTPGEHTVRIVGDDRFYQAYEEVVRLDRGEVRSLGPVRLRVLRGRLELRAGEGADGASVAVDGRRLSHLPTTIELSADESHEVTADKAGYAEFTQDVVFDGTAERRVTIAFAGASGSAPAYRAAQSAPVAQAVAPTRSRAASTLVATAPPAPAAPAGTATLDITSTPPAAVVVNGRPLGTTPLHNVHVGAGKQTVLFVHPSLGRKVASANVAPGGRATIGVKF